MLSFTLSNRQSPHLVVSYLARVIDAHVIGRVIHGVVHFVASVEGREVLVKR